MYGHNGIQEVQASEISYVENYKKAVSISLTIYVLFGSVHTCYTFHTAFQVKRRRVKKDDGKRSVKKRARLRKESNDERRMMISFFVLI